MEYKDVEALDKMSSESGKKRLDEAALSPLEVMVQLKNLLKGELPDYEVVFRAVDTMVRGGDKKQIIQAVAEYVADVKNENSAECETEIKDDYRKWQDKKRKQVTREETREMKKETRKLTTEELKEVELLFASAAAESSKEVSKIAQASHFLYNVAKKDERLDSGIMQAFIFNSENFVAGYHMAIQLYDNGELDRAMNMLCLLLVVAVRERRKVWQAECKNAIAGVLQAKKQYSEAESFYRESLDLTERKDIQARVNRNLSALYSLLGDMDKALKSLDAAIEEMKKFSKEEIKSHWRSFLSTSEISQLKVRKEKELKERIQKTAGRDYEEIIKNYF